MTTAHDQPLGGGGTSPEALLARLADAAGADDPRVAVEVHVGLVAELTEAAVAVYTGTGDEDDEEPVWALHSSGTPLTVEPQPDTLWLRAFPGVDETVTVHDVAPGERDDNARGYGVLADGRALRNWMATPVRRRDGSRLGVLAIAHPDPHTFAGGARERLEAVARHLGVGIEHATALEELAHISAALQETLLPPRLPRIPGVELAARYRPAGDELLVGGDFYDVFPSRDERWIVAIGDVCGSGPEAAAVTGVARYALRAAGRWDPRPGTSLEAVNDAILSRADDERFCTAVVCTLETGDHGLSVVWSAAGHPPPLVLRANGEVEVLDVRTGPLLGVYGDARYLDEKIELQPGDTFMAYTDGLIEARDPHGDLFGEDRLQDLLATYTGRSADGIARRIELAVLDHLAAPPADDLAIVVLRAAPEPKPLP